DFSGSTTHMEAYVQNTKAPHYLLLTECSMSDNIQANNPEKDMLGLCSVRCPHMNEITLEDTLLCLQEDRYEIQLDEAVRVKALRSIERMFELG
ncbi:quinolinate synthase NadA, partial [Arthrospira platensis SPKY1]|nr:quinolinate synthase NadA [Arthrospira platensis SPKY1]